jgi:hypothetical protein
MDSEPAEAMSAVAIAAVTCVPLTNVVVRLDPFTCTTEPLTKFVPFTVIVKAPLPAVTLLGEILDSDGTGLLTARLAVADAPPPGAGFATEIDKLPAEPISAAAIAAVTCVPLTKVVGRLDPFTCTAEPFTKFEPFTVRVKAPLPATTVAGDKLESDGVGLLTVKASDVLVPPPGVDTVTDKSAAVDSVVAGIVALNCPVLTKVVLRFDPLIWIADVLAKFVPVAVRATALLPANAVVGEIPVRVGATDVMMKFSVLEVQPPPSVFTTLSASCPATPRSLTLS